MKRVLALVAAVAMVGGAFLVRSKLIDDNGGSGSHDDGTSSTVATIGCAPELMPVCEALASKSVKVFPDPVDLDNAVEAAPKLDAWLTYGPAPGMVNASVPDQSTVFDPGTTIAGSRLAVVTSGDRAVALARYCAVPKLTWACLVRSAGMDWTTIAPNNPRLQGTVKIGVGMPSSALGTILVGPAALATAKVADPGIDDIDAEATGRVVSSVDQQAPADELTDLTTKGFGAYSAVVAPAAAANPAAASARGQGLGLMVIYPEPVAMTVVVVSSPHGRAVPRAVLDGLDQPGPRRALARAGWPASTQGRTTGLPAPDVLFALRKDLLQ